MAFLRVELLTGLALHETELSKSDRVQIRKYSSLSTWTGTSISLDNRITIKKLAT